MTDSLDPKPTDSDAANSVEVDDTAAPAPAPEAAATPEPAAETPAPEPVAETPAEEPAAIDAPTAQTAPPEVTETPIDAATREPAPAEPEAPETSAPITAPTAETAPAEVSETPIDAPTSEAAPAAAASEPESTEPEKEVRLGTIAGVKDGQVRVDFFAEGVKTVGLCPAEAFKKIPRVGEHVEFAIDSTDPDGTLRLSRAPQVARIGWKSINRGDELDVQVSGMNTGGLEIKIPHTKVRGFMPLSQIDMAAPAAEDLAPYLGKTMHVRVTEVNPKKKRLVVSHRALIEGAAKTEALAKMKVGDELEGKVRTLAKFGVFVEVAPGVDGLVRMGDLAWHHVPTAEDACKVDEVVKVKVVQIDTKAGKLGLSIKALQPNPWDAIEAKYPVGSKQKGTVVKLIEFGCFVELEPGIEGMIHISQLSDRRIEKVEHAVKVGQTVEFKVREIDPRRRRISLSIRALTQPDEERAGEASRSEIRQFTKREKDAHAMESLMAKFGDGGGLKGGIG